MSASETNPFKILGVPETATLKECETAYRRLALKYHPNKGGDSEEMKRLSNAIEQIRARSAPSGTAPTPSTPPPAPNVTAPTPSTPPPTRVYDARLPLLEGKPIVSISTLNTRYYSGPNFIKNYNRISAFKTFRRIFLERVLKPNDKGLVGLVFGAQTAKEIGTAKGLFGYTEAQNNVLNKFEEIYATLKENALLDDIDPIAKTTSNIDTLLVLAYEDITGTDVLMALRENIAKFYIDSRAAFADDRRYPRIRRIWANKNSVGDCIVMDRNTITQAGLSPCLTRGGSRRSRKARRSRKTLRKTRGRRRA
jgi:hypothetical protein